MPQAEEASIFDRLVALNKQIATNFERCTGVSPSRFRLLQMLYHAEEISQTALQKEVGIDHAAVTRHLKQLEADGVVTRRTNPADNRITLVRLTEQGRGEIIAYKEEKARFVARMLQDFSEEERRLLADMLDRMLTRTDGIQ
ncbi:MULTISPECIES: MarR family winged helix-turn-helix transcriptional regulator [Paenibacillus]|uniref:MarR family winged helix-turn-helix transcriptional regulator n=1 Tax=Paenibacillus TaxID=44249 RepID=UPI0022B8BFFF|nr:MarR family transcriptional regulator [Paenibacillus caseinilyticus]MCZ8520485.1 MarR family transcriptional regulator [Paenibacillus caseinilyticus]